MPQTHPRPLSAVMAEMPHSIDVPAGSELERLVELVKTRRKAGKLTVTLTVKPHPEEPKAVVLEPQISMAAPKRTIPESAMFVEDTGRIVGSPPEQTKVAVLHTGKGE